MNPYQLIKDLKRVNLFSPLLVKSFTIESNLKEEDSWIATVRTSFGPFYIRETSLGYVEVSIPILSVKDGDEGLLSNLLRKLASVHKDCMGHISLEEGASIFYHLPIVNEYNDEILKEFVSTISEEADLLSNYITDAASADHVDLDKIHSLIEDYIDDIEDQDESDD